MKKWERWTIMTAAEILCLAWVLVSAPAGVVRVLIGLPILAHLGYSALTSLPIGVIPTRPTGSKAERRNLDLRARVTAFLNEVRRVEEYAQRSRMSGRPEGQVHADLRSAEQRMMAAAAEVARATGRSVKPAEASAGRHGPVLTHATPDQGLGQLRH